MARNHYSRWRDLVLESWDWTPNHHSVDQLRTLFSQLPTPSLSHLGELRLIERRLGLSESQWSLNGRRLRGNEKRQHDRLKLLGAD